jgi:MFS family permease
MKSKIPIVFIGAWLLVAVYYFFQYALRSAPSVMMPQLTSAFAVDALGVSAIVGMFYYGYSPFSLVAGAALDRFGARRVIPIGAALVGIGAMMFGLGNVTAANIGRFLQGAGGAFALVAPFISSQKIFRPQWPPPSSAPRKCSAWPAVQPANFWSAQLSNAACRGGPILDLRRHPRPRHRRLPVGVSPARTTIAKSRWPRRSLEFAQTRFCKSPVHPLRFHFRPAVHSHHNFGMTWGVRFLQEARGREFESAVALAATVPIGWMIGCPLLGFISDRIGRRKPVISRRRRPFCCSSRSGSSSAIPQFSAVPSSESSWASPPAPP